MRRLRSWNSLVLDGEILHMRCYAHIINLIVNEGLKEIHDSISSVRNAVRYVRSSPKRLTKFKDRVEQEKITLVCLDVATRWNSTHLMHDHALKFEKAFKVLEEEELDYIIVSKRGSWKQKNRATNGLEKCCNVCKVFEGFL